MIAVVGEMDGFKAQGVIDGGHDPRCQRIIAHDQAMYHRERQHLIAAWFYRGDAHIWHSYTHKGNFSEDLSGKDAANGAIHGVNDF